ncbi:hypothetical protein N7E81_10830 [Reichenbachiella carrageenanivorans]|uniref:Beta-galactosidase n=1 Tax=Reichenbachiella carrageenanivorans TaxID=2979869 RepID=A0ABY6CVC9_9BACT|nr:hypothetical protein [Reichenbachiella carrageenanivorans]UXX77861.1 hypothetical protein N7E81_10830 [Reichenbachiella carrageenanivorans]
MMKTLYALCLGFLMLDCTAPQSDTYTLIDFDTDYDSLQIRSGGEFVQYINGENGRAIVYQTRYGQTPGLVLGDTKANPWQLTGYHTVKADVTNTGDVPLQAEMFVGNDPDGLVRWYCSDYVDLAPGESKTITVPLAWTPWVFEPQLHIVGMRGAPGQLKTDVTKIHSITFVSRYATVPTSFSIDNIRAEGRLEVRDTTGFFPFVDAYGQYKHRDWPGKTLSDSALRQDIALEDLDLQTQPQNLDAFGGWTAGPQLAATGFFRTEKYQGKWWMVDPEGYLFWSNGLNCVNSRMTLTGIAGREKYFENLPAQDSPLVAFYREGQWASHGFYQGKTPFEAYSFYEANLYRKFGDAWQASFRDLTHRRFRSWGMNTFGNVSDNTLRQEQRTPYVGTVWIRDTPKIEGSEGFWGKFHDVFDPAFRLAVRQSMEGQKIGANDPWCIGFFVDNELSWGVLGSLTIGVIKSPATQPAKVEWVNDLKAKYNTTEHINEAWKIDYQNWEEVLRSQEVPDLEWAQADLNAFYAKIAQTYFRIISEELAQVAPNHLYLGCRFAWANNEATVRAAAQYCDVVSFNKYEYSIADLSLPSGVDKPVMIGEYHFGATDRGHIHPGVKVAQDQAERGKRYESYIQGALRNPQIVGAHWFQYTDQAMTGREDGENYNVGFVDICDKPYSELIEKVRETNYQMYEWRLGG